MAEASLADFKTMLGGAGVADDTLQLALNDAKRSVMKDGVGVNHADFSQLQRYKAAHLLTSWGQLKTNVTAEAVGDVSRSYGPVGLAGGASDSYQQKYRELLISILGLKHKVA